MTTSEKPEASLTEQRIREFLANRPRAEVARVACLPPNAYRETAAKAKVQVVNLLPKSLDGVPGELELYREDAEAMAKLLAGHEARIRALDEVVDGLRQTFAAFAAWIDLGVLTAATKVLKAALGDSAKVRAKLLAVRATPDREIDPARVRALFAEADELSRKLTARHSELVLQVDDVVENKAVRTLEQLRDTPGKAKIADVAAKANTALGIASKFIPPGYKWTASLTAFLIALAERGGEEVRLAVAGQEYRENETRGTVYAAHDENPLTFATGAYKDYRGTISLAIKGVSATPAADLPAWGQVTSSLATFIDKCLDEKLADAAAALAPKVADKDPREPAGRKSILADVRDTFVADLQESAAAPDTWISTLVITETERAEAEPGSEPSVGGNIGDLLSGTALSAFLKTVIGRIVDMLPLSPAVPVSGEDMKAAIHAAFMTHLVGTDAKLDGKRHVVRDRVRPDTTDDGRDVDQVLSEVDAAGRQWVLVGGEIGTLDGAGAFTAGGTGEMPDAVRAAIDFQRDHRMIPTEVSDLHLPIAEIDMARSPRANQGELLGRVVVGGQSLWGTVTVTGSDDEAHVAFAPTHPDDSAFASWRDRTVAKDGYTPHGGAEVTGTWHKPWDHRAIYLFTAADGTREWGRGIDKCRNSDAEMLGDLIGRFVTPGTTPADLLT